MKDAQPRAIYLRDYTVPAFLIDTVELFFELDFEQTYVESRLAIRRNPQAVDARASLVLDGEELELQWLRLDQRELAVNEFSYAADRLEIRDVPDQFVLHSRVRLEPHKNTALSGLYKSRSMFCTQCEAEGFRRITFFPDRPDVLSVFTTTITAPAEAFPVLLGNGNPDGIGKTDDGRHWARWHDPIPKPAYLFALVAGDLQSLDDEFVTRSGKHVTLRLFVEAKDLDKTEFAMRALKQSMRWDEEKYNREYDLDVFMIVAVDDFNMGAMENKGLNIFNTAAVLANPAITTDASFQRIAGIVAHEYFHNWSGNRVTCRDWFQLSLKEGFTVFRDAEFSADHGSATVKRIEDVALLRSSQFAEDAGPMAHPVRPDSYIEINNFYTLTVYEKGAEVVRMIRELIGHDAFYQGADLYFARHDGQAVTCDDFVRAMEDCSGRDLGQFKRWYSQAGTPLLTVRDEWDESAGVFTLHVSQSAKPTPGQTEKAPWHIPLRMGLVGSAGDLSLQLSGVQLGTEAVLELTEPSHTFRFEGLNERPVASLLRGFSAPVKLDYPLPRAKLAHLARTDSDGFVRWDSVQSLALQVLLERIEDDDLSAAADETLLAVMRDVLNDASLDGALAAQLLSLPTELYLSEQVEKIDPLRIHRARRGLREQLAKALRPELLAAYRRNQSQEPWDINADQIAKRSLKNICLGYLCLLDDNEARECAKTQFDANENMTDVLAAMTSIVHNEHDANGLLADRMIAEFKTRWQHEALAMNLWLQVQSTRPSPSALQDIERLRRAPEFDIHNPNKVRALIGAWSNANPVGFHRQDSAGYVFLASEIAALDAMNPQIAARLLTPLTRWKRFEAPYAAGMKAALQTLLDAPSLSRDSYEVVSKSLE